MPPQDIIERLIFSKALTKDLEALAKTKTATRLKLAKNSNDCTQAWEEWNILNNLVKPFAKSSQASAKPYYDKLADIYNTLSNGCGPDLDE